MIASRATFGGLEAELVQSIQDEPEIPVVPPGEHELPCEDDENLETDRHRQQMVLLIQTLKSAWADRRDFYVAGNMFVYFDIEQTRGRYFRGPDVFVVLGAPMRERRSWVAWAEGGKLPNVVIELLSDRTRKVDRGEKMEIYSRVWRTAEYYLYDPISHELEGYRLDPIGGRYVRMVPDARGDLPCGELGLALGLRPASYENTEGPWLRFIGADGEPLPTSDERLDREREDLFQARQYAEAERERAEAERERAEAERERAEAERERADSALARAETERTRAEELEARVKELESELRKR
jgi:Uma2 family endonuclease